MAKKDFMRELTKLDGALVERHNPFAAGVRSSSPSFNNIFGKTHVLPRGYSAVLWGPPKSGKSSTANDMIGQTHRDYPDGYVIKYDTEMRDEAQLTPAMMQMYGIDPDRYLSFCTNSAESIFDALEQKISALCDDGMDLPLVIVDSLSGIVGRRAAKADSISKQQIGDRAQTIGDGLKRILVMQRKHRFAMVLCDHARVEMDEYERMRNGHQWKMAAASAAQHYAEYFIYVDAWKSKEGKTDLLGNELVDDELKDLKTGKAQEIGHKVRVKMVNSSLGPKGRTGVYTLQDDKGIVNQHEEVFLLAKNRGLFEMPNNRTYVFGDKKWLGIEATLNAIRDDEDLSKAILSELRRRDSEGKYAAVDLEQAKRMEEGED